MRINPVKPDRNRINLSDKEVARAWVKRLGHPKEDIAAAIEKVGDNAETVRKELGGEREQKDARRVDSESTCEMKCREN